MLPRLEQAQNVIRADAAGDILNVRLWCFRIRQARTAVNGTVRLQMSNDVRAALDESRDLTEGVCIAAGVPAVGPITVPLPDGAVAQEPG